MAAARWALLGASLIAMVIGILACADHVRETGREDPPECVIDELAGQWLACAFCLLTFGGLVPVTHSLLAVFALAFLLFRLFDIWKPWPVSWADTEHQGRAGRDDRRHDRRPDGGRAGGAGALFLSPVDVFACPPRTCRETAGGCARQEAEDRHGGKLHRRADRGSLDRNSPVHRMWLSAAL